jgi:hypothetical protein
MSDDERQAQALRGGLDQELASVHATAQARERLIRSTRNRAGRAPRPGRAWRPILALPLAGALVATVIAVAVVVPTVLRSEPESGIPAGNGLPSGPAATASSTPTSEPTPTPTPGPAQESTDPQPTDAPEPNTTARSTSRTGAVSPSDLRLSLSPEVPAPGGRAILNIPGTARHGTTTVDWGDRSSNSTVPGNCARAARPSEIEPIVHNYRRAGSYRVQVTVDRCGSQNQGELTVVVAPASATPAPSR